MDSEFYYDPSDPIEYHYAFQTNVDPTIYNSVDNSISLIKYDLQLKPTEFVTKTGFEARYPVYTMTNPLAPVKDSYGFLPPGEKLSAGSVGYPTYSPGWEAEVTFGTEPAGTALALDNWGPSTGASGDGVTNVVTLELPTSPITSIGKLQHANITIYDHMPALAIGNSFASPFIDRDSTYALFDNRWGNERIYYDISYLMNEALWDSYYFSSLSIPYDAGSDDYDESGSTVSETFDAAFDSSTPEPLPNPRVTLSLHESEDIDTVKAKLFTNGDPASDGYARAAENLMVAGTFNVNSTSIEAWQAVLSGARDQQVYLSGQTSGESPRSANSTPFSRLSQPTQTELTTDDLYDSEAWGGFRTFSDTQIFDLATNIVAEIQARSSNQGTPFLTLSEFINRRLSNDQYGLAGVLQAAIDATTSLNNRSMEGTGINEVPQDSLDSPTFGGDVLGFPNPENLTRADGSEMTSASSASTYLLQADILQSIGAFLNARSDCFRIRAYGESVDPNSSGATHKAWCEAIVQRIPEPLNPRDGTDVSQAAYWSAIDADGDPTAMGRKFQVISFRWLSEDEV